MNTTMSEFFFPKKGCKPKLQTANLLKRLYFLTRFQLETLLRNRF